MALLENPLFLLLVVILLGYLLGKIRLGSFSLDSSGIVFIGPGFGLAGFTAQRDQNLDHFIHLFRDSRPVPVSHSMKREGLSLTPLPWVIIVALCRPGLRNRTRFSGNHGRLFAADLHRPGRGRGTGPRQLGSGGLWCGLLFGVIGVEGRQTVAVVAAQTDRAGRRKSWSRKMSLLHPVGIHVSAGDQP